MQNKSFIFHIISKSALLLVPSSDVITAIMLAGLLPTTPGSLSQADPRLVISPHYKINITISKNRLRWQNHDKYTTLSESSGGI